MENIAMLVGEKLLTKSWFLATAESCTGGMVSMLITDVAGSSQWFERGFVTYSNQSKQQMLGVSEKTLNCFGAVSHETVQEMVVGAIKNSNAHCGISISGIAGPDGGSEDKPVGTVFIGWKIPDSEAESEKLLFQGSRQEVREQAAQYSLEKLFKLI